MMAAGSPGIMWIKKNTMIMTRSKVGVKKMMRFRAYLSMRRLRHSLKSAPLTGEAGWGWMIGGLLPFPRPF